jgi:hypothetical protein
MCRARTSARSRHLFFPASAERPLAAGRKRSQRSTPHPVFPAGGCTICVGRLHKELRQLQRRNDPRIKLRLFAEPVLILELLPDMASTNKPLAQRYKSRTAKANKRQEKPLQAPRLVGLRLRTWRRKSWAVSLVHDAERCVLMARFGTSTSPASNAWRSTGGNHGQRRLRFSAVLLYGIIRHGDCPRGREPVHLM